MRPYFRPDRIWAAGQRLPHLYVLPEPQVLAPLLEVYDPILAGLDFVRPVPRRWLHATLIKITAQNLAGPVREELVERVREVAGALTPIPLLAGPALAGDSAIVLDLTPDHGWTALRTVLATAVTDLLGPGSVAAGADRPHLTLAYGTGTGDSGVVQSRLRRATGARVPLMLDTVHLVEVEQVPADAGYRWTPVAQFPLPALLERDPTTLPS